MYCGPKDNIPCEPPAPAPALAPAPAFIPNPKPAPTLPPALPGYIKLHQELYMPVAPIDT